MTSNFRHLLAATGIAAAGTTSPALAIDPFFPDFGNDGINVLHYDISLDVEPAAGTIAGKAVITLRAPRTLDRFALDLHALSVSEVLVNGTAANFSRKGDKLEITPAKSLRSGEKVNVTVAYGGVPDPLADPTAPGDNLFLGWFNHRKSAYVVSEPVGASTFFPANDEPTDKATYRFKITVPEGYTAVANGTLVAQTPVDGKRRFIWSMTEPMTTWLATVHVNKFTADLRHAPDGTPISLYVPEGTPQSHIDGLAKAGPMLTYFETLIGRYPFRSYGSVIVDDPKLYYALETQAMSTFPEDASPPDEAFVSHELAHQWFGNSVSVAKWEDLWIAEGAATFFETWWQHRKDRAAFDQAMLDIYDYVVAQNLGPAVVDRPEDLFSDRTYYRGGAALYALQLQIGDSSFFNIMKHFAQDNRGRNVTSEDFIATAVRFSGDGSVRTLLESWLYDDAVPALPGKAKRTARTGPVPRPDIVGGRCGRGSHRGAPAACG